MSLSVLRFSIRSRVLRSQPVNLHAATQTRMRQSTLASKSAAPQGSDTPQKSATSNGLLRDQAIPYDYVRLVDNETKKPGDPIPLSEILASLKGTVTIKGKTREANVRYAQVVRQPSDEMGGYALVKLFDRAEMYAKKKTSKIRKQEVRRNNELKEVQMTFGVAAADAAHKLRKVRQEIERGHRVVLVATEKDSTSPSSKIKREECIAGWLNQVEDIAREWCPRQESKHSVIINLQHIARPSGRSAGG